ncbi:hypothetical protein [Blastochloris viridis]|uniref:Uncharacterized protein n=1 Tax=Blastochloris viridis TaxID=1079 RepID=A0A0H5BA04_BLAVI|nr:hypothetical protein [Blastochloris viridis]ALK11007.1 hypothetical protein BVIR_3251 [Blastochloris viridis]BAR99005.1 hypothetical protein BV133_1412 [Blastochloris viridis]CUU43669.1 hypothetical protein BVIRIDIS_26950 [Blastochloris viridis]
MCDYSLHHVASRPAKVGETLVSTTFPNSITRGFTSPDEPNVAVCLLPGTELGFEKNVECEFAYGMLSNKTVGANLARFRQVNLENPYLHHDALEFPNGETVLVTHLCQGQRATVLQLPAGVSGEADHHHPADEDAEPATAPTEEAGQRPPALAGAMASD